MKRSPIGGHAGLSLALISMLIATAAPQIVLDVPLPKRCHLAAPCTRDVCSARADSKERWVAGGAGVPVQLAVVCLSPSGSAMYGTGGFFTYSIRPAGSTNTLSSGKFNQFDVALQAHVSPTMELPLGSYSVAVEEGQLEANRVAIADGKPYQLEAVLYAPPAPAAPIAEAPSIDSQAALAIDNTKPAVVLIPELSDPSDPNLLEGQQQEPQGLPATETPPALDIGSGPPASPGSTNSVALIAVVVSVLVLSMAVLGVGVLCYVRGREDDGPPVGFLTGSPKKRRGPYAAKYGRKSSSNGEQSDVEAAGGSVVAAQYREETPADGQRPSHRATTAEREVMGPEDTLFPSEQQHVPPDFTSVEGPRRPARGKRAKNAGGEVAGDIISDYPQDERLIFGEGVQSHRQHLRPDSAANQRVTIAGPAGQDGIQLSSYTARLLASNQALPGMYTSSSGSMSPTGQLTQRKRLDWGITSPGGGGGGSGEAKQRLQPLMQDGTNQGFQRRYNEVLHSREMQ